MSRKWMVGVSVAAFVAVGSVAGPAAAQEHAGRHATAPAPAPASPKNTLTVLPFAAALGFFSFEYERAVSDSVSIFASPTYFRPFLLEAWTEAFTGKETEIEGYMLEVGPRYFFVGTAPEGLWVAPAAELGMVSVKFNDIDVSANALGYAVAASVGFNWLIGDVVDFSMGVGARHYRYMAKGQATIAGEKFEREDGLNGTSPFLRFALGAAF
jgi:hypothetical protein